MSQTPTLDQMVSWVNGRVEFLRLRVATLQATISLHPDTPELFTERLADVQYDLGILEAISTHLSPLPAPPVDATEGK